jgi:hypothetical protein
MYKVCEHFILFSKNDVNRPQFYCSIIKEPTLMHISILRPLVQTLCLKYIDVLKFKQI